jgi:signal transduction histidine kinase
VIFSSLRLRLVAAGALALVVVLLVARVGLLALFERHVERRLAAELGRHLDQVIAALQIDVDGTPALTRPLADPRFDAPLSGLYWQVVSGSTRARSRSLWDNELDLRGATRSGGRRTAVSLGGPAGAQLVAVAQEVTLGSGAERRQAKIIVASARNEIEEAVSAFSSDAWPYMAALAALVVAAGALQITLGLRPLSDLRRRVLAIRTRAADRLGEVSPSEIQPLAQELDELLAAREQAIAQARGRAADLAHGLRTPLQVLQGDIDRLRAKGEHGLAADIAEVAGIMQRHVERELVRARMGQRRSDASADVAVCIERIVAVLKRTPAGSRLRWSVYVQPGIWAAIDPDDLTEALGNLVENAVKFASNEIEVVARGAVATVEIVIRDDGRGFAKESLVDVMARGKRLDERGGGAGLGLAIVGDLAEAWGGGLKLDSSPRGVTVTLALPAADHRET